MTDEKRITAFSEAASIASDDFLIIDSPTAGTRKFPAGKLAMAAQAQASTQPESWSQASSLINAGFGPVYYPTSYHVDEDWYDVRPNNTTKWAYPTRVVESGEIDVQGGLKRNSVTFQSRLALPFGTQFSNYQAFLTAGPNGLPAGTYKVSFASDAGGDTLKGKTFQFTLTQAVPAGGQICGFEQYTGRDIKVYASATAATPTETVTATEGSSGTSLGTFTNAGYAVVPASGTPATTSSVTISSTTYTYYGLNSIQRVAYGNNRWLHSAIRQFLNGSGSGWWAPATVFDRPPSYVGYDGFLTGFSDDLVDHMAPRKIKTSLNTVTDGGTSNGTEHDITYDKVWLPSSEQMNLACTSLGIPYGVEGDAFEYWVMVYGSTPATYWTTHTEFCMASMDAPTTMRGVFQRSPNRGSGYNVAYVASSGGVATINAVYGYFVAPAYSII